MADSPRDFDLVVYGATGFVGRLVAGYLTDHADPALRIGLAGRSSERLEAVRADLGPTAAEWPLVVADSTDPASVVAMCERTRVLATTVGPYARYGLPVVEACARAGTHYADITGEVLFVRECIDRFHDVARDSGARIVHACGFDSIPSDLGVQTLHDRVRADGEGDLTDTALVLRSARGGLGGGTIDSLRAQVDAIKADPALRRTATDPYGLSPAREQEPDRRGDGPRQRDAVGVTRDSELGLWTAPFVMSLFNTRIVRRSNALLDWTYGRRFSYREVVGFGTGPVAPVLAAGMTAGLGALTAAMTFTPARALLDRVLPDPGEGPSETARQRGHFRFDLHAATTTGARYSAVIAAQGDPGFAATAVMLAESALALADGGDLPDRAGVLTPATGIDGPLTERLRAHGFTFDVTRA